ncbi:MAG: hypothetical protein ACI35O_05720 [Bacillaceae bacterium]
MIETVLVISADAAIDIEIVTEMTTIFVTVLIEVFAVDEDVVTVVDLIAAVVDLDSADSSCNLHRGSKGKLLNLFFILLASFYEWIERNEQTFFSYILYSNLVKVVSR